jgi:AraC family transcriptional activator of pobA
VLFLFGGEVRAAINEAVWDCRGPVAITVHPSLAHGFDFSPEAHGYVLTVHQNLLFSASEDLFSSLFVQPLAVDLTRHEATRGRIEALLQQLMLEAAQCQQAHTLLLEWLARSALLLLRVDADRRSTDHSGRSDFELFSRFRAEVEQRYRQQWQVGRYAEMLRVTSTRLNRLCRKLSGKSAFDIVQDRLILEACRKLAYVPASIASVGYELGFQDAAYFSRLFKKRMGVTPKQFRGAGASPLSIVTEDSSPSV